jgi:hypothetical protein
MANWASSPEQIDREESARVERLRKAAREGHARLQISKESAHYGSKKQQVRSTYALNISARQLGLTRDGVASLIQQKMSARDRAEEFKNQNPPTVHVKDGKPLTAQGARMLGVPWSAE